MIPNELYKQIIENMPVFCIDVVLVHEGKVFLTYRNDEPAKNQWWIQGGRVWKNEKIQDAVQRLAKREIGSEVEIINEIGTYEVFFNESPLEGVETGIHDLALCFLVKPKGELNINLDKTHKQWKWVDSTENLHPYVKKVIEDSKVFEK
jgi:colanic acid biosynthesis protein WcaH